jgi:serine protease Do
LIFSVAAVARALRLLLFVGLVGALAAGPDPAARAQSSAAEAIYASAPPRLLQVRTVVVDAGRQVSNGSGFLVTADGLAITNYHVVAQVALEPKTYRLEYVAADGSQGAATLLDVDLPDDLAIIRIDKHDAPFFTFDDRAMGGELPKGERLYSMGNPLDLGFTIVEGTYNGLVEHSYNERLHFTGALNPGMSGGPAVTADGRVVGINVATRRGGQLISFLVPARFAAALLERARGEGAAAPDLHAAIGRQLTDWRSALYKAIEKDGFRTTALGPYRAPETQAQWFNCWASTNAGAQPAPRASINSTSCTSDTGLFVAADLNTGTVQITHSYAKTIDLNQFQFATVLTQLSQPRLVGGGPFRKWYSRERCQEDFVAVAAAPDHPPLRAIWCAQAYREFEGLYDVALIAVTQDHNDEALVSRLSMQAVGYDDAVTLGRRFLEAVQVSR